jgi:hypothetical protein
MYDRKCVRCERTLIDCWEPITAPVVVCECGGQTERVWLTHGANVIGDDIPGGYVVKHGACNEDGSPRKFYSKAEILRVAKERGWVQHVQHVTDPQSGSDKNKHTTRWY